MKAGGVLPGPEPFVRAEVVHCSERTRVTRLFLPGRTVIRKEPLGPDADRRVRREAAILERLPGLAGVTQLAEAPRYPGSVVLQDAGEASLAGCRGEAALDVREAAGMSIVDALAERGRRILGWDHPSPTVRKASRCWL